MLIIPDPLVVVVVHRRLRCPRDGVVVLSGSQCSGQDAEILFAVQAEVEIQLARGLEEGVVDAFVQFEGAPGGEVPAPV